MKKAGMKMARPTDGKRSRHARYAALMALACAVVAATCGIVGCAQGWGGQADAASGQAAKVDDAYISEEDVANWISQYRKSNSLTDEVSYAQYLASQSMSVLQLRTRAIEQLATNLIVQKRAEELGVVPSDEEVQAEIDAAKATYALDDDSTWNSMLEQYGMSEDDIRRQYKINLEEKAIAEKDVAKRDPTDQELLSFIQTYLMGTTQKHAWRIVFKGDDAQSRAQALHSELIQRQSAGTLNLDAFEELARSNSDDENVQQDGGEYVWSGSSMNADERTLFADTEEGGFTEAGEVGEDGTWEILYCDTTYTFSEESTLTEIPSDLPDGLREEIEKSASESSWQTEGQLYISNLVANAQITIYPMPGDASYKVDMTLAMQDTSSSSSADSTSSSGQ